MLPGLDALPLRRDWAKQARRALAGLLVPTATVIYTAAASAPSGYLKANGTAVSRTTYAALFAAIGTTYGAGDGSSTFNLPDLRGEFPRGWDDGRGVDAARAMGSAQSSQNLAHTHTATTAAGGAHTHSINDTGHAHTQEWKSTIGGTNAGGDPNSIGNTTVATSTNTTGISIVAAADHTHGVTVASDGGTEARPRNVALLACIKF